MLLTERPTQPHIFKLEHDSSSQNYEICVDFPDWTITNVGTIEQKAHWTLENTRSRKRSPSLSTGHLRVLHTWTGVKNIPERDLAHSITVSPEILRGSLVLQRIMPGVEFQLMECREADITGRGWRNTSLAEILLSNDHASSNQP